MNKKIFNIIIFITLAVLTCVCKKSSEPEEYSYTLPTLETGVPVNSLDQFEERLEGLRIQMNNTPGMSAAIVKNQQVVWAKGFGYADKENKIKATPNTVYSVASITKPFGSTILMQLVEEGKVNLETPISEYGLEVESSGTVRVKHILTHTSEGIPGSHFNYDGDRFLRLDTVIEESSGKTFAELLAERIVSPLEMTSTACHPYNTELLSVFGQNPDQYVQKVAKPYWLDGKTPVIYDMYFGTSAGIFSSVLNLAKFAIAIDKKMLLKEETWNEVFTPITLNNGLRFPYGYAWFVQQYRGVQIIWHGGCWTGTSAFFVRIPEKGLTFIIMGNTRLLQWSHPQIQNDGDVTRSVIVMEFLNAFVFGDAELPDIPYMGF